MSGRWIHESVFEAVYGSLIIARDMFDKIPHRNIVAWNFMINAYNQYEKYREALDLVFDMFVA